MTTPQRITLSRARGFNLQAASMALNGLPAVKVDRTTKFGNPFPVAAAIKAGLRFPAQDTVNAFRDLLAGDPWACFADHHTAKRDTILMHLPELRGKNLACWCKPGQPCHAEILLELANRPICDEVK